MTKRRTSKTRSRSKTRSKSKADLRQQIADWRGWQRLRPEVIGFLLLLVAALTYLGLSEVSTGAILEWWADLLRQVFGWGAYLFALSIAILGLRLVWRDMDERVPIGVASIVGLELLFLVILVFSHAPLVLRSGADEAWVAATQGEGGGFVGWALAVLLVEGLGVAVGGLVVLAAIIAAIYLILTPWWGQIYPWGRYQVRRAIVGINRWFTASQGTPVVPEPKEVLWWEEDPPPEGKAQKKSAKKSTRRTKAKPRPADGSLPPLDLLDLASPASYGDTDVRRKSRLIEDTLDSFGVPARVVEVNQGPTVTQFGLDPGYVERRIGGEIQRQRVRVSRISSLASDLSLALAASPIRIEAPVPGRSVVGLEVPNDTISLVSLRGVMEARAFKRIHSRLAIALGEDVSGRAAAVDLGLMPHLLIAGATGSGKSVCINAIVCCLLFNNTPDDLQLLMVDPKMVELVGYNDIPHLVSPVVIDVETVLGALAWVTRQMDQRYKTFHKIGARNLEEYNQRAKRRKDDDPLPTLVVIIDELADLMMVAPDEVERHICRVAQMGRATGIHLVIATQRPSVDVVTGLIKANFPARISFAVTSQTDSRVILDQGGAENLLGRGDMLFMSPQQAAPVRLQGCFVSDKEIDRLTGFWQAKKPEAEQGEMFPPWTGFEAQDEADTLLDQAAQLVEGRDRISTSWIQRQMRIGFPRAARLVDQLEERGVVGPDEGAGRGREVLVEKGIDFDEIDERLPGVEPK
jgi:S-DNA-T family DNA segregation ATPase FtsK/SpoIIIE